jgi:Protein kinase domain
MLSSQTISLSQIPNDGLPLKELTRSMVAKYFEDSISDSLKLSILPEDISKNKIDGKTMEEFIASELKKVQYNQNIPQSENFDQILVSEIKTRSESDHPFESPNIILGLGQLYNQAIELLETLRNNDPMYLLKTIILDELNREKDFSLQTSPKGEIWTKIYRIFEKQIFLLEKKEKASKGGRIAPYETLFETLELFKTHEEFQKCVKELSPSFYKKLVEAIGSQNKNGIHKDNFGHYQQLTKVLSQIAQQLRIKYQLWKPLISLDTFSIGVYSTKVRGYDPNNKRYYTKKSLHTKDALAINYIAINELISIFTLQLQDDEDFIKVYSIDFQAGVSYSIVTEFGLGNLSEFHKFRLRQNIPWSQKEIIQLSKSITKQLQKLKDLDIAHRDINPENIIVTEHLTFKIKDFSTSEMHKDHETQFIIVGGTPGYWHAEIEASIDKCHNIVKLNPYENDKYSVERIISLIEQFMNKSKSSENSLDDAKEFKKHMIGRIYKLLRVPEQPKLTVVFTALYS